MLSWAACWPALTGLLPCLLPLPLQVGKTTLVKCLIKHYTRQDVRDIKGPVTVIAGKTRRLTFVECPQDLSAMIDAGAAGGTSTPVLPAHSRLQTARPGEGDAACQLEPLASPGSVCRAAPSCHGQHPPLLTAAPLLRSRPQPSTRTWCCC